MHFTKIFSLAELNRCGLCLIVIWIMNEVELSKIVALIKLLDEHLCKSVSGYMSSVNLQNLSIYIH